MPDVRGPFALPEFTRSLRHFASVEALADADHEVVFGPLLAARKAAARVSGMDARLAAFDAGRLRRALGDAIDALTAARHPKSAPDRRALVAELEELAAPIVFALERVDRDAERVRAARSDTLDSAWATWVTDVHDVFASTDRFWGEARPVLGRAPLRRDGAWRRHVRSAVLVSTWGVAASVAAGAQHVTLRIPGVRAESLLAHGFDVVSVERGSPLVVAGPRDRARLEALGWAGSVVLPPNASNDRIAAREGPAVTKVYRSYDDPQRGIRVFIDSLVRANPRVSVDTLGFSYEKRPMLALKLGPKGDSPQRPNVLFMAAYHAREWAATEMALRLVKYLADPPPGDARLDSLLKARDIWIVPVANPDGYQYTFTNDRLWRKTRSPQGPGVFGVDMNRNHRQNWGLDNGGSSPEPLSEIFRGTSPASEIETRNIEAFHAAHPPVVSLSYHTYAGLLLFPPSARYGDRPADLGIYQTLAGTNQRSAVIDRLPGSARSFYSPSSAWMLYSTNGEYGDWASTAYGSISFTPEISSGYEFGTYYGFEFFDDEAKLQTLFADNLPFALDIIESARDPLGWVSPTTFASTARVAIESVSPDVRVRVNAAAAPAATIVAPTTLSFRIDSLGGGRYMRRLVTGSSNRPKTVVVTAGGQATSFAVVEINGAEESDAAWTATQFRRDSSIVLAGRFSWATSGVGGDLRSPGVRVAADVDTVTVAFWTRYDGSGFDERPFATVRVSTDSGISWTPVMRLQGFAPTWYPERVTVGGVKGKPVSLSFLNTGLSWNLDEIAIVSHTRSLSVPVAGATVLRPSENPVHRGEVYFPWPFAGPAGDLFAYDFSGRLVWRSKVAAGETSRWDLRGTGVANGVYVVIARSGSQTLRLKLYVVRDGT